MPLRVGFIDAARERFGVMARGEHLLTLISKGNRRACILAARQYPPRGNVGILQQFQRHETIIVRGFRVVQNVTQLFEVTRS